MEINRARAFELPDGSYILVEQNEGGVAQDEEDTRTWKSVDVSLVRKNGRGEVLCTVDYEDGLGLRTLVYDGKHYDPVFSRSVEINEDEDFRKKSVMSLAGVVYKPTPIAAET